MNLLMKLLTTLMLLPPLAATAKADNKVTPVERIKVAKGFKIELLYSVPSDTQGSWVNLCADNKGRLLVSDQFGGLYQMTPPAPGETLSTPDVKPVPANIRLFFMLNLFQMPQLEG